MLFSERYGYTKPREAFQLESMDDQLRNMLWNIIESLVLKPLIDCKCMDLYANRLWHKFYKEPQNSIPLDYFGKSFSYNGIIDHINKNFYSYPWYKVYDYIEFTIKFITEQKKIDGGLVFFYHNKNINIENTINSNLKAEMAGYRIINGEVAPITNEDEIKGIEEALESTNKPLLKSVNTHLKASLTKLSDRQNPDFRNSIKESISAVEAIVNIINGANKGTLGEALKKLKAKLPIHIALEKGFSSIYGYTSDASGIRHAIMDDAECDFDDAKYMLVSCSAFVNYLIGKASKAGIL